MNDIWKCRSDGNKKQTENNFNSDKTECDYRSRTDKNEAKRNRKIRGDKKELD